MKWRGEAWPEGLFETPLQNVISISIISPDFRTIRPVVTESLPGQNLSGFGHVPCVYVLGGGDPLSPPF